jgi:hypothetical protein
MIQKVDFKSLSPTDTSLIINILKKEPSLSNILIVEGQVIYKNKKIVGDARKRRVQPMINVVRV